MRLLDKIKDHILLMDGAMGTYYNQQYGTELEAEEANLVHPEEITAIHKAYIEAGAELIRTNTFAVNHLMFPKQEECKAAEAGNPLMRKQNSYAWRNKIIAKNIILLLWSPLGTRRLRRLHVIGKCARIKVLIRWNVMWI